ncbi:MAG: VanZ family protein [Oscillospiraceae bacterium]|nr:VanZ family protein [Oscillospiraceae bacterium]
MSLIFYVAAAALNVFWLLAGDKLSVNHQLMVPMLSVVLVGLGVLLRVRRLGRTARRTYCRNALWLLLIYYLAILSVMLFFGGLFHLDRAWGGAVNLEPFYTISRFWFHFRRTGSLSSLFNLLGNVVILIPLGVLLPVMFRPMRRIWLFVPLMAAVCIGVEWLQWYSGLGIADVDDSILNFIGAVAGWVVTGLFRLVYSWLGGARE